MIHHLVFGRKYGGVATVPYEIIYNFNGNFNDTNGVNNLVQNGTVIFTTDRKGGNTAIQLGSGYLQTANNLPASNVWSVSFWIKNTTTDFKVLFLDDVFIGLDLTNRLPILDIIKNEFYTYKV